MVSAGELASARPAVETARMAALYDEISCLDLIARSTTYAIALTTSVGPSICPSEQRN
jgi:hypothetical protein